jgi:hypothetical protein
MIFRVLEGAFAQTSVEHVTRDGEGRREGDREASKHCHPHWQVGDELVARRRYCTGEQAERQRVNQDHFVQYVRGRAILVVVPCCQIAKQESHEDRQQGGKDGSQTGATSRVHYRASAGKCKFLIGREHRNFLISRRLLETSPWGST